MKIKLDENLGNRGKDIFIKEGFETDTVTDQEMCSTSDTELIKKCKVENSGLVSLNKDFPNPLIFRPSEYSGIAVIRLSSNPTPKELYESIQLLASELKKNEIIGKLWIIQRNSIRVYQEDNFEF